VGPGIVWPGIVLVGKMDRGPGMSLQEEGALVGILSAQTVRQGIEPHPRTECLYSSHPNQTISGLPAKEIR
jgi:hypothetical protein